MDRSALSLGCGVPVIRSGTPCYRVRLYRTGPSSFLNLLTWIRWRLSMKMINRKRPAVISNRVVTGGGDAVRCRWGAQASVEGV
ncbi:hypothetical protein U1Q18_036562 [Sarracenia purpurea var. burkii]